jgi:nitroreductase
MELIEAMMTQKSIRRYTDAPVTDDEILQCLRAAIQAPNGGNDQPWQWLVVTDAEKRRKIGEIYRRSWAHYWPAIVAASTPPDESSSHQTISEEAQRSGKRSAASAMHLSEHMGEAPALVMLIGSRFVKNYQLKDAEDNSDLDIGNTYYTSLVPALQNFMLAARGLGIGTCLTTMFRIYQDEIRAVCGIPSDYEIEALVPMGRPKGRFGVAPRKPAETVTSWDTFGEYREPSK